METEHLNQTQNLNKKFYAPNVTLSTKDNVKLVKQLNEGFKRPVYLNEYKTQIKSKNLDNEKSLKIYAWCFISRS